MTEIMVLKCVICALIGFGVGFFVTVILYRIRDETDMRQGFKDRSFERMVLHEMNSIAGRAVDKCVKEIQESINKCMNKQKTK